MKYKIDIKALNSLTKVNLPSTQTPSNMELKFIENAIDHFLYGVATSSEIELLKDYKILVTLSD